MSNATIHAKVIDKRGFEVQFQESSDEGDTPIYFLFAYNFKGQLIGDIHMALNLITDRGISPELIDADHEICSIGFCDKEQEWYGWSHRAIYGFGIGYIVSAGDIVNSSGWTEEYLQEHPKVNTSFPVGFEAKTLEDCRTLAIAFANSAA